MDKINIVGYTDDEKLKKITEYFGIETEIMKLSEEMGELINEYYIMHFKDPSQEQVHNVEDELADVFVVLAQLILYAGIDMDNVTNIMEQKINRTIKRIDEDWYKNHR